MSAEKCDRAFLLRACRSKNHVVHVTILTGMLCQWWLQHVRPILSSLHNLDNERGARLCQHSVIGSNISDNRKALESSGCLPGPCCCVHYATEVKQRTSASYAPLSNGKGLPRGNIYLWPLQEVRKMIRQTD